MENIEGLLYSDQLLEIYNKYMVFHNYYFPTSSEKRVYFSEIEKIVIKKATVLNGKLRFWGTGDFLHWFPRDYHRNKRDKIFFLFRKNKRIRIGFTAENTDEVTELLKQKINNIITE